MPALENKPSLNLRSILSKIFPLVNFVAKNPLRVLIWLFLIKEVFANNSDNQQTNVVNLFDTNRISDLTQASSLQDRVEEAIATDKYEDMEILLENRIKTNPNDVMAAQERLRLITYRELAVTESFRELINYKTQANKLLELDPGNEFALSIIWLANIKTYEIELHELPKAHGLDEVGDLHQAIAFFTRGYFNFRIGVRNQNIPLLNSALNDVKKAIQLEKIKNLQYLYSLVASEAKNELAKFKIQYPEMDFSTLKNYFVFSVNVKNIEHLLQYQGNVFNSQQIKNAIQANFPLLLRKEAQIELSDSVLTASSRHPLFLLSKDDYFYIYTGTFKSEHEMLLQRFDDPYILKYDKLSDSFFEENVAAIIGPYGDIITKTEHLSILKFPALPEYLPNIKIPSKTVNTNYINETPPSSFTMILVSAFITIISFLSLYFLIKPKTQKDLKVKLDPRFIKLSGLMLSVLNEQFSVFTSETPWKLQLFNSGDALLTAELELIQDTINISIHPKHAKKYKQIASASIIKEDIEQLLIKNLKELYRDNIKISNGLITIRVVPSLQKDETAFINDLKNRLDEILEQAIQNSPEYHLVEFFSSLKKIDEEANKLRLYFEDFWSKNQETINQFKFNAISYTNSLPQYANKANEMSNLCNSFEMDFKFDKEENSTSDKRYDSLSSHISVCNETIIKLRKEYNLLQDEATEITLEQRNIRIRQLKAEIHDADSNIKLLKIKVLENDKKLARLKELNSTLDISLKKLRANSSNNNNVKTISKPTTVTKAKGIMPKESEEERASRLKEFKEKKELQKKAKLVEQQKLLLEKERKAAQLQKEIQIKRLKNDLQLIMLEHQTEMLSQVVSLFKKPEKHDMIKFFSSKPELYDELVTDKFRDITYYTAIVAMIRITHSLGQMMTRYEKFYLLNLKPYMVRNFLMHKFWLINAIDIQPLMDGSEEFIKKFDMIHSLRSFGFPDQVQEISMTTKLFSEAYLMAGLEQNITLSNLITKMDHHFQVLCFINKLISYIRVKNEDIFIRYFGLMHQAIVGCISLIGVLLHDLKNLDINIYIKIKSVILSFESLKVAETKSVKTIYQDIRVKVGHHFSDTDKNKNQNKFFNQSNDVYKEVSPRMLPHICQDSANLYEIIAPIFQSFMTKPKMNPNSPIYTPKPPSPPSEPDSHDKILELK